MLLKCNWRNFWKNINIILKQLDLSEVLLFLQFKIKTLRLELRKLNNCLMQWINVSQFLVDQLINHSWCQLRGHTILQVEELLHLELLSKARLKLVTKSSFMDMETKQRQVLLVLKHLTKLLIMEKQGIM